ncbi:MAG TPA: hypothetical protein VIV11_36360 [Kofleriaceae bacterium]
MATVAIAVMAACGFDPGTLPGTDGPLDDGRGTDALSCAAIDVAAGGDHTCAISGDGSLYCWGRGDDGQIGIDPLSHRCVANTIHCQKTPAKLALPPTAAVGLGGFHTCSTSGEQAYCWGKNSTAQYGNGTIVGSTRPTPIDQRTGATAFDGGTGHGCSLVGSILSCSGANGEGQVGNMSIVQQATAVAVKNDVASFSLGTTTSCAVDTAKSLYCWGRNAYKTIDQTGMIRTLPTLVAGITDVDQVAVGADHVCAVTGGVVKCWGLNSAGQVGNGGTNPTSQPQPITTVTGIANAVEVVASRNHTCARTAAGDVYCFGDGYTPTPALVASGATKITGGSNHDCAVFGDGTVRCWGDQTYGQLGNNVDSASRSTTPQPAVLCP